MEETLLRITGDFKNDPLPEIVIIPDNAVFWMDDRGHWCNEYGPFENNLPGTYFFYRF